MGSTHTSLIIHVVFSTHERKPWLGDTLREHLFKYLGGAVGGQGGVALSVGGVVDHVHMLLGIRPDVALSTMMREVKVQSSRWVHETYPDVPGFRWQEGYAAFTVSRSQVGRVKRYIDTQEEHHRVKSFTEELVEFLDANGVDYDERYL